MAVGGILMNTAIKHRRVASHFSWAGVMFLSWLSMTLGLFGATAVGHWVRQGGAHDYGTKLIQGLVITCIVVPAVYWLHRRYNLRLNLLPVSVQSFTCFLSGLGLAFVLAAVGVLIAEALQWIEITEWHLTAPLLTAVLGNILIAFLYEALPEELSMRGMVFSGLRLRLPSIWAYLGQMILFVLVPVTVTFLQQLAGIGDGGAGITLDYVILLLVFGLVLQLWRSLTSSLWASIGFHLAFLEISRFVIASDSLRLFTYTEKETGTGEIFVLFGMILIGAAVILALLNIRRIRRAKIRS
jgi:uncharacterized protein